MKSLDASAGWTEGPSEGYLDFAQAVAIAPDGSMVIVRVGDPLVIESGFVSNIARPMINCGDVGVVVGAVAFAKVGTDAAEPYEALVSGACGAANMSPKGFGPSAVTGYSRHPVPRGIIGLWCNWQHDCFWYS